MEVCPALPGIFFATSLDFYLVIPYFPLSNLREVVKMKKRFYSIVRWIAVVGVAYTYRYVMMNVDFSLAIEIGQMVQFGLFSAMASVAIYHNKMKVA